VWEGSIRILPGQYRDAETGLFYNYQRDYDPQIGRYVQSDPLGLESGLNTYAYVDGDPVGYSDPEGATKRGGPNQAYANQVYATTSANYLIGQIRQYQPNFSHTYVTAPGQGGYSPAMIRSLQQTLLQLRQQALPTPNYVVTSSGSCMPVPQGSALIPVVNPAGRVTGQAFSGGTGGGPGGLSPAVTQLRLMNSGYANYMNASGQSVNPFTGQTLHPADPLWHIPY
jgi:RHS repeat-associated protein